MRRQSAAVKALIAMVDAAGSGSIGLDDLLEAHRILIPIPLREQQFRLTGDTNRPGLRQLVQESRNRNDSMFSGASART